MTGNSIDIRILSHDEHDELIASIECDGQEVAVISQDLGPERLKVFLYPRADGLPWRFKLADLESAIASAKKKLLER